MNDLQTDYQQAGFGLKLGFGAKPALILIDFVGAYFIDSSPLHSRDAYPTMQAALQSALRLRKSAHRAGVPVILTKVELTPCEIDAHLMFRKTKGRGLFDADSPFADFAAGLSPEAGEYVLRKAYASSFFATPLASFLNAQRVDSLVITGLSTSGCVRATCSDCISHGFVPLVVRDAVADRDSRPHEANLFDMGQKYADIVSEKEVSTYLEALKPA